MERSIILQGVDINRAMKDEEYRATLTEEQRSQLLEVAGNGELSDDELDDITGGLAGTLACSTEGCTTKKCQTVACAVPISTINQRF